MYEFLLGRRYLDRLNDYLAFLNVLPQALEGIKAFSVNWARQGHVLNASPDIERLIVLSSFGRDCIERLGVTVSSARHVLEENFGGVLIFLEECIDISNLTPESKRRGVSNLDCQQFTFSKQQFIYFPPTEVRGLTHELYLRLFKVRQEVIDLKISMRELDEDIHTLVSRFVCFLSMSACRCHSQQSQLETVYSSGVGVFSGKFLCRASHLEYVNVIQAKQHLHQIRLMYAAASSAIHNLNDFFFAVIRLLDMAQHELLTVRSSMTLSQLILSMTEAMSRLQDVMSMAGVVRANKKPMTWHGLYLQRTDVFKRRTTSAAESH